MSVFRSAHIWLTESSYIYFSLLWMFVVWCPVKCNLARKKLYIFLRMSIINFWLINSQLSIVSLINQAYILYFPCDHLIKKTLLLWNLVDLGFGHCWYCSVGCNRWYCAYLWTMWVCWFIFLIIIYLCSIKLWLIAHSTTSSTSTTTGTSTTATSKTILTMKNMMRELMLTEIKEKNTYIHILTQTFCFWLEVFFFFNPLCIIW
jgi:hypothetical protein